MANFDLLRREPDVRVLPPGETVFAVGEPGDFMFVVLEGEVAIEKDGKTLEVVSAGGVFGEMALIDHSPRSASAITRTQCTLAAVGQKRFTYLVQQTPFFALEIM